MSHALRRTLAAVGVALAEQVAPPRALGWLSGYDARAKILAAVVLIVSVSLLHGLVQVAVSAALGLLIALCTGLRGRRLRPLWLGVPLFTLALAVPATLNLITPGQPLWVLFTPVARHLGPWPLPAQIAVTMPGLIVAARFFLRTIACVACALSLTASTDPASLVSGLRRLGMPRVFGMVLTMMQRYLVVVLRAAENLHLAKLSRTLGPETVGQGQRWAASGMGILLLSSLRLAEGVHQSMVARGYDGDIRTLAAPRFGRRELLLTAASALLAATLLLWDRLL